MSNDDLRYPIGRFAYDAAGAQANIETWIAEIAAAPAELRTAVANLSDEQLATPYRPGGWTVRQVVHHLPDSHVNAYVRFRLALTEDDAAIRPYDEKLWAELPDASRAPIDMSLNFLHALHVRWVALLRAITPNQWRRTFYHPELDGSLGLLHLLALYAWHGKHHVAHVTSLRERMAWD